MKGILIALALLMVGCSSNQVQVAQSDRYSKLEPVERLDVKPIDLPERPELKVVEVDGQQYAALQHEGVESLLAYREAAERNTEALELLVTAHNDVIMQRNLLLENTKLEEGRANFYSERFAETEELRREQYRSMSYELMFHKAMLVLLGALLVF